MILMPMGYHKTFDFRNIFFQIGNIRNDKVDTEHVILRECQTTVHNHNAVFVFESCDVHSDLLKSTKRNNFQLGCSSASPAGSCTKLWFLYGLYCRFAIVFLLWLLLLFVFEIFLFRVLFLCIVFNRFPVMVIVSSRFESAVSRHTFSLRCMRFILVHIIFYTQSSTSIMLRVQSHFKVYVLKHLLKNFIYCLQFVLIFNHFIAGFGICIF